MSSVVCRASGWNMDPEEYREMVCNLAKSPPAKRVHREYSPDWNEDLPETAPEI